MLIANSRFLLTGVCILFSILATAQNADTIRTKPFDQYWTKPRFVPKVGVGVQDAAFAEVGVQYHQIFVHPLSLASAGPYLTFDGIVLDDDFILGPKLGYEFTAGLIGLAADFTYYTDFDRESVTFTPKVGLSLMGFVNLFYGRNFVLSEDSFKSISKSRFSLVFNINRDYFDLREAKRR